MKNHNSKFKLPISWLLSGIAGSAIILLGFILRIYHLTLLPVFVDEAIYIRWSQIMASEPTLRFLPLSDGKQPFFMWILMFIVKRMSDPLFAGRLLSVFSGLGTIVGVWALVYLLFKSQKAALLAALLVCVSPFSIFFDRLALVDSMLSFFGIWVLILAILTSRYLRFDLAMLNGFALGGALLTKSPAIFFILLLPSAFIFAPWPKNMKNKKSLLIIIGRLSILSAVSYLIAFAMYNILRLGPNFNMIGSRNLDYVYPINHIFQNPWDPFLAYIDRVREWLWLLLPSAGLILAITALANTKKYPKEILILFIWAVLPLVIQSEYAKVFTARYILYTVPILLSLAASTVLLLNRRILKYIIYILYTIYFIHSLLINRLLLQDIAAAPLPRSERSGYLEEWTAGQGIKEISEFLKKEHTVNPQEKIVVGTEGYFGTLPDGLQIYMESVPNTLVIGVGLNIHEVPVSLKESFAAGNKTYLVVNDSRFTYLGNPEEIGLKLISSYEKAERPNFVKEYSLHGPREHLLFFAVTAPKIQK